MIYFFFLVLGLLVFIGSAFFLGRPTEGTVRIFSSAALAYIPVGPWYATGFSPIALSCFFIVLGCLLSSSTIKATVIKSSIRLYYRLFFRKSQQISQKWDSLLNNYIGLFEKTFKYFPKCGKIYLIYYPKCGIIKE